MLKTFAKTVGRKALISFIHNERQWFKEDKDIISYISNVFVDAVFGIDKSRSYSAPKKDIIGNSITRGV